MAAPIKNPELASFIQPRFAHLADDYAEIAVLDNDGRIPGTSDLSVRKRLFKRYEGESTPLYTQRINDLRIRPWLTTAATALSSGIDLLIQDSGLQYLDTQTGKNSIPRAVQEAVVAALKYGTAVIELGLPMRSQAPQNRLEELLYDQRQPQATIYAAPAINSLQYSEDATGARQLVRAVFRTQIELPDGPFGTKTVDAYREVSAEAIRLFTVVKSETGGYNNRLVAEFPGYGFCPLIELSFKDRLPLRSVADMTKEAALLEQDGVMVLQRLGLPVSVLHGDAPQGGMRVGPGSLVQLPPLVDGKRQADYQILDSDCQGVAKILELLTDLERQLDQLVGAATPNAERITVSSVAAKQATARALLTEVAEIKRETGLKFVHMAHALLGTTPPADFTCETSSLLLEERLTANEINSIVSLHANGLLSREDALSELQRGNALSRDVSVEDLAERASAEHDLPEPPAAEPPVADQ